MENEQQISDVNAELLKEKRGVDKNGGIDKKSKQRIE